METRKVTNTYLSLKGIQTGIQGHTIQYPKQQIAGQFHFKIDPGCKRHSILIASRFNKHSREQNPPFPGWFIQIVGDRLSMGIGNGKTWLSVKCPQPIQKGKVNLVQFSLNNETKRIVLGLNNVFNIKENISFKCPVAFLTVGALNMRGEFRFDGELNDIFIGTSLEIQSNNTPLEVKCDIKECVETSHEMLDNIKNNLLNIHNDIKSLQNIKENIQSWKLRGLQLDTVLLDNQIKKFIESKNEFTTTIIQDSKNLQVLNHKINQQNKSQPKTTSDVFGFFKETIQCLYQDIKTLDNVVTELMQFKELGVELGNAFDSIKKQRLEICEKLKQTLKKLKEYEHNTREMMNIVQIHE